MTQQERYNGLIQELVDDRPTKRQELQNLMVQKKAKHTWKECILKKQISFATCHNGTNFPKCVSLTSKKSKCENRTSYNPTSGFDLKMLIHTAEHASI